ncbi:hypothetical protein OUZ56_016675 [Daphnia magna]|uniref:Uncharacterized protein n=1 Tax=Daphnia magna TaxID=35525 RepID=A0ABR0ARP0_9CRUS|nr:hypothetical protein OUZ56_016675 [Daphnia magna]
MYRAKGSQSKYRSPTVNTKTSVPVSSTLFHQFNSTKSVSFDDAAPQYLQSGTVLSEPEKMRSAHIGSISTTQKLKRSRASMLSRYSSSLCIEQKGY